MRPSAAATKLFFRPRTFVWGVLIVAVIFLATYLVLTDRQFRAVRLLNSAYTVISRVALEVPTADSLVLAAADGMMSVLDPYCEFLSPSRRDIMREEIEGSYFGIGVEIVIFDGVITVVSPIPGTPAHRAGLQPGDRIVEIDGESARGIVSSEAVKRLRGQQGTTVILGVERADLEHLLVFELERDEITIRPVNLAGLTPEGVGYVRLARFSLGAAEMLDSILHCFLAEGSTAWILDLRGNPGGFLNEAVQVAGCFLSKGTLVCQTRGRNRLASFSSLTSGEPVAADLPLVVLIDGSSASASEIVAAAITDHRRGVIAGRRSFGKGLVQSQSPLNDRHALQLTTGRYFTPAGYSFSHPSRDRNEDTIPDDQVQKGGLTPHVTVESDGPSALEAELLQKGTFLNFVVSLPDSTAGKSFDDLWDLFLALIGREKTRFVTPLEYAVAQAESVAALSPIAPRWKKAFTRLWVPAKIDRAAELANAVPRLKVRLAESLVLFGGECGAAFLPVYLSLDEDTKIAVEILTDPERYRSILGVPFTNHEPPAGILHGHQGR